MQDNYAQQKFNSWFEEQRVRMEEVFKDETVREALKIFANNGFLEGFLQGVKYTIDYNKNKGA